MADDIFNAGLLSYAKAFRAMAAPLGDHAPRCRLLSIDYKDCHGTDFSQDIAAGQNPGMTDGQMVELIREQYANQGFTVSAITEITETASGIIPRALYIRPGFIEEGFEEQGFPVPEDLSAALSYAGIHPVNWEELVHGR